MEQRPRFVYFAEKDGLIKIGCSFYPTRRCQQLKAVPLGALPGAEPREQMLHEQFSAHRDMGEWFRDCIEIRQFIEKECEAMPLKDEQDFVAQPQRKVVLEPDLDKEIERLAREQDRSVSAQIRVLLREAIEAQEAALKPGGGKPRPTTAA